MRNLKQKIHSFENHQDEVTRVEYSPFNGAIFGSSSKDRRINIWDISKCGMDMKAEDIQDGPPELLFVHGGHKSYVDDFSWD
jgi:histone-binding protein RBBP4